MLCGLGDRGVALAAHHHKSSKTQYEEGTQSSEYESVLPDQILLEVLCGVVREGIVVVAVAVSIGIGPLAGVVRERVERVVEAVVVGVRVLRVSRHGVLLGVSEPVVVVVRVLVITQPVHVVVVPLGGVEWQGVGIVREAVVVVVRVLIGVLAPVSVVVRAGAAGPSHQAHRTQIDPVIDAVPVIV